MSRRYARGNTTKSARYIQEERLDVPVFEFLHERVMTRQQRRVSILAAAITDYPDITRKILFFPLR